MGGSVTTENTITCNDPSAVPSNIPSSQEQNRPDDEDFTALLDAFPEAERPAILDHLRSLVAMSLQKRAAVLMLTRA